jgi:hypothetical protein
MMAGGDTTGWTAMALDAFQMATFTSATILMADEMATAAIFLQMATNMLESSRTMQCMGLVGTTSRTTRVLRVHSIGGEKKEEVNTNGLTEPLILLDMSTMSELVRA